MLGRALYSPDDFEMRSTPAQYSGQRAPDLFVGWLRVLVQKSFCSQDHSVDAVAALRSLLVDEGLLDRVRTLERSEPPSVTLSFVPIADTGVTHERMVLPPAITVHAPHCPRPQPNFGPSSFRSFRRT